ncbi:helix-turn-helix domain-containing protein [Sulfurospirillum arcachonense]|uniref:helix-turn-helix domain-containing protein n=1 Tax=Sulfurospirillum arcachonense TaxID=57666 RepID=UPI00146F9C8A|nr:AraC family transcriptional regulator [Sulfurospirillum arcachonense]
MEYNSIEELVSNIDGFKIEYLQIGEGKCKCCLNKKDLGPIQIYQIEIDKTIEYRMENDVDYYCFSIPDKYYSHSLLYTNIYDDMFILSKPNCRFFGKIKSIYKGILIIIKKEFLNHEVFCLEGGVHKVSKKSILFELKELIYSILSSNDETIEINNNYVNAILKKIMQMILNVKDDIFDKRLYDNKELYTFYKISRYMKENIVYSPKIISLSKKFNIHERTLRNIFIRQIGISPKQYQKALKMNILKVYLIKNPKKNISNALIDCGLEHQSLVSRDFKKYLQVTPSEYRSKLELNSKKTVMKIKKD